MKDNTVELDRIIKNLCNAHNQESLDPNLK